MPSTFRFVHPSPFTGAICKTRAGKIHVKREHVFPLTPPQCHHMSSLEIFLSEICGDVVTFSHRHGMSDGSELPLNSLVGFLLASSLPFHLLKFLIPLKLPEPTHLVDEVIQIFVLQKMFSRTELFVRLQPVLQVILRIVGAFTFTLLKHSFRLIQVVHGECTKFCWLLLRLGNLLKGKPEEY